MKTVIATDGSLTGDDVLSYVTPLAGGDEVVVLTIVEIPRTLLGDIRHVYGASDPAPVDGDAEYVANISGTTSPIGWPGDDAIIDRYLADQGEQRAGPLAEALRAAGMTVTVDVRESEEVASAVLAALKEHDPGVVVAAATGRGLFQGLLGSTSTKLMRLAPCPVLLIRA